MKIKIGLIGAGYRAQSYLRVIRQLRNRMDREFMSDLKSVPNRLRRNILGRRTGSWMHFWNVSMIL